MAPETTTEEIDFGIGTTVALEAMEEHLNQPNNRTDTILLNATTFIRNRCRTTTPIKQLATEVVDDIQRTVTVLEDAIKSPRAKILLYYTNYEKMVAANFRRPPSKSRALFFSLCFVVKPILDSLYRRSTRRPSMIDYHTYERGQKSYQEIVKWIHGQQNTHQALMFSHMAVDMHVAHHVHNFQIVESFTGEIKSVRDIGPKIWKHQHLPFTLELHALLGDKDLILCQLSRSEKTSLLKHAEDERWQLLLPATLKSRLSKLGYLKKGQEYPLIGKV